MPSLSALISSDIEVIAVVTNPDRPAGRGYELRPPPVKVIAEDARIEVLQPTSAKDPGFISWLQDCNPDVAVVVAYGKLLPAAALAVPRAGFVNLHFSLLPELRGAAPVQRAVMQGFEETGVSIMVLTEGMDEGPVLASRKVAIDPEETAGELGERLAELGAPLLVETARGYVDGDIEPVDQDHRRATYAPKIDNDEARIDWTFTATQIHDLVRGLDPVPGAWTTFRDVRLKIHRTKTVAGSGAPGDIIDPSALVVAAGSGALQLTEVQPAGKRSMAGQDFVHGAHPGLGERFG